MQRAVIYCRVSTKEQVENLSLATQEKACREYCARNGLTVVRVFVDKGESAKTADRTEFKNLLTYCRENRGKLDALVVYNLSRFSRNTSDHVGMRAAFRSFGVRLRSVTESIDDTPGGKFMEIMFAAVAQLDNDMRAERTVAGMKAALEQGRWTFQAPTGYLNRRGSRSGPSMVHDPAKAPLVRQAFEDFASGGFTVASMVKYLDAAGLRSATGKVLRAQAVATMLRNPIYAGWVQVDGFGIRQRGDFEPLVSEEAFQRVQDVLSGKRPTAVPHTRNHPDFALRRFVRCGHCGTPLTGAWSTGRQKTKYAYYRCRNRRCLGVNTRRDEVEAKFVKLLAELQPRPAYMRGLRLLVLDKWRESERAVVRQRQVIQARVDELLGRRNRLVDAYLHEQLIDRDTYEDQKARLDEEIAVAQLELSDARDDEIEIEEVLSFAERILTNAADLWHAAGLDDRQRFQAALFPKGLDFDGREFGTVETCLAFGHFGQSTPEKSALVSPRIEILNTAGPWLAELADLQTYMRSAA
jgi:site-specific DNA recombinase